MSMKKLNAGVFMAAAAILAGCVTGPDIIKGKGNVFGVVTARPHKQFVAKYDKPGGDVVEEYGVKAGGGGGIAYAPSMVNYDTLDEIYVGLLDPKGTPASTHAVTVTDGGMTPPAIAVATGDTLRIRNDSARTQTFFIADPNSDAIVETAAVSSGASADLRVPFAGILEVGSDEDERLSGAVLSLPGMTAKRVTSGQPYSFVGLDPGPYGLVFWYWRLGMMEKSVRVPLEKSIQVDATLSVDTLVR